MNNDPAARRVQVFADPSAVARAAAEELTRRVIAAVREHGRATVALAGGSTPKALYGLLADEPAFRERLPWAQTHFFFGDERHVPPDHKDSNYRMAAEALFNKIGSLVPAANLHRILAENPDAYQVAADYAREVENFFGKGNAPRFDLILLGMGPDGHTASLFPGTTGLRERDTLVAAAFIEKFNTYRVTFTPPLLSSAAAILFLVGGKDKAEVLQKVLEGPSEPDRYPSQGITAPNGETLWLLDAAAAEKLSKETTGKAA
jgi:6-phosphogluconolactonase